MSNVRDSYFPWPLSATPIEAGLVATRLPSKSMTVIFSKEVEVEIELCEIGTENLLEELMQRGSSASVDLVLQWLDHLSLPNDLVDPIKDYFDQPAADLAALARWVEFANA